MILELVKADHPILNQKAKLFDWNDPPFDPIEFAKDIYGTMVEKKGLGLAAPQVGVPFRVFSLYSVPGIVCYNPYILDQTSEMISLDEGCLSFPNLFFPVKRPRRIKVRYREPNGNPVTTVLDGITARAFLHEYDHLEGIVFTNRGGKFHVERALRKKKLVERDQKRKQIIV